MDQLPVQAGKSGTVRKAQRSAGPSEGTRSHSQPAVPQSADNPANVGFGDPAPAFKAEIIHPAASATQASKVIFAEDLELMKAQLFKRSEEFAEEIKLYMKKSLISYEEEGLNPQYRCILESVLQRHASEMSTLWKKHTQELGRIKELLHSHQKEVEKLRDKLDAEEKSWMELEAAVGGSNCHPHHAGGDAVTRIRPS